MMRHLLLWVAAGSLTLAPIACADDGGAASLDGAGGDGGGGGFVIKPKDAGGAVDPGPAADAIGCTPNKLVCIDGTTSATCNPAGDGYAKVTPCPSGKTCRPDTGECLLPFCEPGKIACVDQTTYRTCAGDGSAWGPDLPCPDKYVCSGAECIYERCLGHVLLVVDRSGSMFPHWQTVLSSITTLVQDNANARFGLVGFPTRGTVCGVRDAIEVPLEPDNLAGFIEWFAGNEPYGYTPLMLAMQAVEAFAPTLFEGIPGTVIVLSDGADTCSFGVVPELAAIASDLWTQHEIQTYVIGYNFDGDDTSQLDAMASSGGTKYATHLVAGTEEELTNAFKGIVQDFKLCF